jgi:cobalt-precorrin 5A hydrolase
MCKKRMAIVCFTPQGKHLAAKIQDNLKIPFLDICWNVELIYRPIPFRQWMKEHFTSLDALIFIGAMGIVVRDMAPCLKSKLTDTAVVVLDEKGQFVISVLSGHLGSANALTKELANKFANELKECGAKITFATTDLFTRGYNYKFAKQS